LLATGLSGRPAHTTPIDVRIPLLQGAGLGSFDRAVPSLERLVDPLQVWPVTARLGRWAGTVAVNTAARVTMFSLDRALMTPLALQIADAVLVRGVAEQIAGRVLAGPELDRIVIATLHSPALDRLVEETLADPVTQELLDRALDSPRVTALAERVLDSDGMERLVAQMLESRLLDASLERILASERLWLVVEEVAQSPAVTAAITHQGAGFADQLADEVGERSRRADLWMERLARRLVHRAANPNDPAADPLTR
jgi:hypothetical protein